MHCFYVEWTFILNIAQKRTRLACSFHLTPWTTYLGHCVCMSVYMCGRYTSAPSVRNFYIFQKKRHTPNTPFAVSRNARTLFERKTPTMSRSDKFQGSVAGRLMERCCFIFRKMVQMDRDEENSQALINPRWMLAERHERAPCIGCACSLEILNWK